MMALMSAHLAACAERWREFKAREPDVQAQLRARPVDANKANAQRDAVYKASNASARVVWMRELCETLTSPSRDMHACRHGCSDCCYQSVVIAEPEARLIAKETGMKLQQPPPARKVSGPKNEKDAVAALERIGQMRERYTGVACVFLRHGRCSIYASRPIACRKTVSLDRDSLLCQIVPDEPVKVPYLDMRAVDFLYQDAMPEQWTADIRDWFAGAGK